MVLLIHNYISVAPTELAINVDRIVYQDIVPTGLLNYQPLPSRRAMP